MGSPGRDKPRSELTPPDPGGQYVAFRYRLCPTRAFEYISTSVQAISGYTPHEFYADAELAERIVHPEDRERLRTIIEDRRPATLLSWVHRDGSIVAMDHSHLPVLDEDDQLVAIEGVARVSSEPAWTHTHLAAARTIDNPGFTDSPVVSPLTQPELDVLWLMAEGLSNAEIAPMIQVDEQTVEDHVGAILKKLGAPNRTAAAATAFRAGIFPRADGDKGGRR
jgi:DNA-binding CsgD family transcriptional regulator